jgi:hypothetical protein
VFLKKIFSEFAIEITNFKLTKFSSKRVISMKDDLRENK